MNGIDSFLSSRTGEQQGKDAASDRLGRRSGLNVPYEWWPRAAALKAIEAAGFGWIQVASPPVGMLADPRHLVRHCRALGSALQVTQLRTVVHAPTDLRLGSSLHNRAGEGLIEYAHQLGASHVVYHALDVRKPGPESEAEEDALKLIARWADTLGVTVCLENLCPVYPGPPSLCHDPQAVRRLVERLDSVAIRMLFDVGHANVVAERDGTSVAALLEPVLDAVALFHVHDNLGARRHDGGGFSFDPLRLDLHLPPGIGTLRWETIAPALAAHGGALVMEIHPSHRPAAAALREALDAVVLGSPSAHVEALERATSTIA